MSHQLGQHPQHKKQHIRGTKLVITQKIIPKNPHNFVLGMVSAGIHESFNPTYEVGAEPN